MNPRPIDGPARLAPAAGRICNRKGTWSLCSTLVHTHVYDIFWGGLVKNVPSGLVSKLKIEFYTMV